MVSGTVINKVVWSEKLSKYHAVSL